VLMIDSDNYALPLPISNSGDPHGLICVYEREILYVRYLL
jgi:hypothetical protein